MQQICVIGQHCDVRVQGDYRLEFFKCVAHREQFLLAHAPSHLAFRKPATRIRYRKRLHRTILWIHEVLNQHRPHSGPTGVAVYSERLIPVGGNFHRCNQRCQLESVESRILRLTPFESCFDRLILEHVGQWSTYVGGPCQPTSHESERPQNVPQLSDVGGGAKSH